MMDRDAARMRRLSLALGASVVAIGACAIASPASAQCRPDPTVAGGTTTCAGSDTDGVRVETAYTTVAVANDATVRSGSSSAAITVAAIQTSVLVNGTVDGAGKPGITVLGGDQVVVPCDPYAGASVGTCAPGSTTTVGRAASATITVAPGSTVTGSQAVLAYIGSAGIGGFASATVVNSGTLIGTAGPAIVSTVSPADAARGSFLRVTNTETGVIAGIAGPLPSVFNYGRINGGADTAIATTLSNVYILNSGAIVSTGQAATLSGAGSLYVTNGVDGRIGGGATAISAGGFLALVNEGTIAGSVVSRAGSGENSTIDTRRGTIAGDLALGAGNDTVSAAFDTTTGRVTSITGAIDGGAGLDTLAFAVASDATFGTSALPRGFELLGFDLSNGATATLAPDFTGAGVTLTGSGAVVNQADLVATGPAVTGNLTGSPLTFTNAATVTATLTAGQIAVGTVTTLTNSGTITANGGGGVRATASVVNTGSITATGVAASVSFGTLNNSGQIASRTGVGASISASTASLTSTNSGTITGATQAVELSFGRLVNTGTIIGSGPGVSLGYGATLVNAIGGVITGGGDAVVATSLLPRVVNAGTINGSVGLASGPSDAVFVDMGGGVNGAIRFGAGNDQLVVDLAAAAGRPLAGATGGVDAGAGYDTLRYRVNADARAPIALIGGFEALAYELDNNAALTLTAPAPVATTIGLTGNGTVTLNGTVTATDRTLIDTSIATVAQLTGEGMAPARALRIVNAGTLDLRTTANTEFSRIAGVNAGSAAVVNTGTIAVAGITGGAIPAVGISGGATVTNSGTITLTRSDTTPNANSLLGGPIAISAAGAVVNTGTIAAAHGSGGIGIVNARTLTNSGTIAVDGVAAQATEVVNTGTILSRFNAAVVLGDSLTNAAGATIQGLTGVSVQFGGTVVNRGAIIGNFAASSFQASSTTYFSDGGTLAGNATFGSGNDTFITRGAGGIGVSGTIDGGAGSDIFGVVLTASGNASIDADGRARNFETAFVQAQGTGTVATITAAAPFAGAVYVGGDGAVVNRAVLNGSVQTGLPATGGVVLPRYGDALAAFTNAGTIGGGFSGSVATFANSGTIGGAVAIDAASIRAENTGTIAGAVRLGAGDDVFVQRASATLGGLVDGGAGTDAFVVDATGNGALAATQITRFEQLTQTGTGTVAYSGAFGVGTIALNGGTLSVAAGQRLSTTGATTVTGGDAGVGVVNAGTIAGAVRLGAGNDSYAEGAGSVVGGVDGGGGVDLYRVLLSGDRAGIGARANFEQLSVEGAGTLTLTLDQSYQWVALAGAGLAATLNGFTLGPVTGSAAAEQLSVDSDVASVALGAGNDTLALRTTTAAGRYDGGDGTDTLRLTAPGAVTLTGTATGFETVALTGGALTVAGQLGAAGNATTFGDGAQALVLARGGTIAGAVDLGAGDDSFRLVAGGTLAGSVAGGAGTDTATIETTGAYALTGGMLTGFERLTLQTNGAVTVSGGTLAVDTLSVNGDLTVAAGATLATQQVTFGAADNRLTIAGGFSGSVAGGAGSDSIDVSGGTATAPVAFGTIAEFEAFRMNAGLATIAGTATLGSVAVSGGRLIGLAGSTIAAPTITVGTGATFGSAGTVTGNIAVAGTLSPGASPGTMTVNGNVSLASGSLSVFEITSTVSDQLLVNGTVGIAPGATLQLVADGALTAGRTLDLISASGGITGSFTTIVKPATLFGLILQDANRIRLLGQFASDAAFTPQVQRSIANLNGVLATGRAPAALVAAAPLLVNAAGVSNQAGFAQITPEAYASARQVTVEQGLKLADVGRGDAFAARRDTPGAFTFASALADTRTLEANAQGSALARINGYGFLGGIGWGGGDWSIGGFAGWLKSRETLAGRGARTDVDGVVAGVHARWNRGRLGVKATVAYDGGNATTRRTLPGGSAVGAYDLRGWTGDLSLDYAVALGGAWAVRPMLGATVIRATRDGVVETGGNAFALDVARDRDDAVFVDGGLTFQGGVRESAVVRPYLALGARYQVEGRAPSALAGLGGGGVSLLALGAPRAPVVATATLGSDVVLSPRLVLFGALSGESGDADHRASARAGLRLAF